MIDSDLKRQARLFEARVDYDAFFQLATQRLQDPSLKFPLGLDRHFLLSAEAPARAIAPLVRQFYEEEKGRNREALATTEAELRELAAAKPTVAGKKKILTRERRREKFQQKLAFSFDRISPTDDRIFPGYFTPVMIVRDGERRLVPMRYRVRRPDGGEVPSQYNVFNARRDSLLTAATWKPLFGRHHAIFPFHRFFEWVERDEKKKEISFSPSDRPEMWSAALYSVPRDGTFFSFAMVTDEPPPEVAAAGHDRCPIFLAAQCLDTWMQPQKKSVDSLLTLLDQREKAFYLHTLVA